MTKVTVLGCGPSGLLAAHAFRMEGHQVRILSKKRKSPIGGAQYLHRYIPWVTAPEPDGQVSYIKLGTREGYAEKVYGHAGAPVSWDLYEDKEYDIWNMRRVYENLWEMYEELIDDQELDMAMIRQLVDLPGIVVSSIPAHLLCEYRHDFHFQTVHIIQKDATVGGIPDNVIMYNGHLDVLHYRYSRIFGVEGWEYANPSAHEYEGAVEVRKPIRTNCTCMKGVVRVGRYGHWQKSQLAHHAYEESVEVARAV